MNYRNLRQKARNSKLTPDEEKEYHLLNQEYHKVTRKWFKRNGREMAQGFSKLEAIKMRLGIVESELDRDDPDFSLGGAL